MNCRDFLIEFEDRSGDLTEAATLHIKICADCQKTSREQTQVWLMIDNLQRVEAPTDFDFHVKARIAQSKPADFQPRFLPVLRYVLPLGLVVLILGALAFNTSFFFREDSPQVAEIVTPQTPVAPNEVSPINSFSTNQTAAPVEPPIVQVADVKLPPNAVDRQEQYVAQTPRATRTNAPKKSSDSNDGGGSRVLSVRRAPVNLPLGIEPDRKVELVPNVGNLNPITDVQILSVIGIETVSENNKKKVKFVKPDSLAERSGVKTGDIVEAVDDLQIGGEPVQMKTSESKKLTVMRDAKRIEIILQNKVN